MKLKINTTHINIFIFISFFFLWGVDTTALSNFDFINNNEALKTLTKYKVINLPITLKTTQGVPLSVSQNPTTQNSTYSNLVINFNKAIKVCSM